MGDSKSKLAAMINAAALALLWCAGCRTPPAAGRDSLPSAGQPTQTGGGAGIPPAGYQIVIPSRGGLADAVFTWQSVIFGPSPTAESVARTMREAAARDTVLLIRGDNPRKTFRVLYDALRLNRSQSLPREIIWVAPVTFADKVGFLHRRFGVEIRLVPPTS